MIDQELLLQLIEIRIKRFLMEHKTKLQSEIYIRCGRGSTPEQFQNIINTLAKQGLVGIYATERRHAPMLTWIEQPLPNNN